VRRREDFLEVGNAPFSEFLHIKGRNYPDVFYPFTSMTEPYEPLKVSWKSVRTFLRGGCDAIGISLRSLAAENFLVTALLYRFVSVIL